MIFIITEDIKTPPAPFPRCCPEPRPQPRPEPPTGAPYRGLLQGPHTGDEVRRCEEEEVEKEESFTLVF